MKITNKRIVDVYDEVSNDFYKNKENKNQKSKHWQSYYGFKKFNTENLINFRSSGIGAGLDDQTNSFTFKTYAEVVNQLSEEYVFSNLPKKNIGKSELLIKYKNIFLDYNFSLTSDLNTLEYKLSGRGKIRLQVEALEVSLSFL